MRLAGETPSELIIVGVVPESCDFGKGISPSVLIASSVAVDNIARLLLERAIDCRRRHAPVQPNLWWLSGERSKLDLSHQDQICEYFSTRLLSPEWVSANQQLPRNRIPRLTVVASCDPI